MEDIPGQRGDNRKRFQDAKSSDMYLKAFFFSV
jgi:hypothetical protein